MPRVNFIDKMLAESAAMVVDDHFVYKAGYMHGPAYLDKEKFSELGASNMVKMINAVGSNALDNCCVWPSEEIGILAPAYGALFFPLTLAAYLQKRTGMRFFPARTEVVPDPKNPEKKIHVIPEKRKDYYRGKNYIVFEDIVNNGTTIREAKDLFEKEVGANVFGAVCFADRGGQTAESLKLKWYYPLRRVDMVQYDVIKGCPLCAAGMSLNTVLGKGKAWVKAFGQPPYKHGTDFSSFWIPVK